MPTANFFAPRTPSPRISFIVFKKKNRIAKNKILGDVRMLCHLVAREINKYEI
jgi:hypothetical protein